MTKKLTIEFREDEFFDTPLNRKCVKRIYSIIDNYISFRLRDICFYAEDINDILLPYLLFENKKHLEEKKGKQEIWEYNFYLNKKFFEQHYPDISYAEWEKSK